jgi:hypothetical protein
LECIHPNAQRADKGFPFSLAPAAKKKKASRSLWTAGLFLLLLSTEAASIL